MSSLQMEEDLVQKIYNFKKDLVFSMLVCIQLESPFLHLQTQLYNYQIVKIISE